MPAPFKHPEKFLGQLTERVILSSGGADACTCQAHGEILRAADGRNARRAPMSTSHQQPDRHTSADFPPPRLPHAASQPCLVPLQNPGHPTWPPRVSPIGPALSQPSL